MGSFISRGLIQPAHVTEKSLIATPSVAIIGCGFIGMMNMHLYTDKGFRVIGYDIVYVFS